MSDSFSPKKQPDFFSPESRERALEMIRQPLAIAALASLGIHGLVFVVLPMLPAANPREIDPKQTVGVVELSPVEQLRLPDFASPQVTLPSPSSNKVIQKSSKKASPPPLFDNSSLYDFPLLSPPPPITILPNLDIPELPSEFNTPPVRRKTPSAAKPPEKTPPKPDTQTKPSANSETTKTPEADASPAPTRPNQIPLAAIEELQRLQKEAQQSQVAQQSGQETGDATTMASAAAVIPPWVEEIAKAEKVEPDVLFTALKNSKKQDLSTPCPTENCAEEISKLPIAPSFLVAVDREGQVINPPLQFKAGKEDLDRAALEELKKFATSLKGTGNYEIYRLRVEFQDAGKS